MNRKSKTILFWIFAGLFIALFILGLALGSVNSIWETGSETNLKIADFLSSLALNPSTIFNWSPFVCLASAVVLTIMFFTRYNSRIN